MSPERQERSIGKGTTQKGDVVSSGVVLGASALSASAGAPVCAITPGTDVARAFDLSLPPGNIPAFGAQYASIHDAADRLGLTSLRQGSVGVWYLKDGLHEQRFFPERIDLARLSETHVHLGDILEDSPEKIWSTLQGEIWSPSGEARAVISGLGVHHTSMDLGDVVVHPTAGVKAVAMAGFARIGDRSTEHGPQEPWAVGPWVERLLADSRSFGDNGLLVIDTETTKFGGGILEVALVNEAGDTHYHAYVLPQEEMDPEAVKVHGLTPDRLVSLGARPWDEVRKEIYRAMRGHVVAQYAYSDFDRQAISISDRLAGVGPDSQTDPGVRWIDIMDPYRRSQGLHKGVSLLDAAKSYGIPFGAAQAHGAVADAKAAFQVLKAIPDQPLVLSPEEVLVRKGEGGLEAFSGDGEPLPMTAAKKMEAAVGRSLLYTWKRPEQGLKAFDRGDYLRVRLTAPHA